MATNFVLLLNINILDTNPDLYGMFQLQITKPFTAEENSF